MFSYQNDPALKARMIAHVEAHRTQDAVRQGTYGDTVCGKWQGCAIACSLRSLDEIDGLPMKRDYKEHERLAARLDIPIILCRLEDRIFEALAPDDALHWPTRFARAIPVGKDLSLVWKRWMHWLLVDPDRGVIRFANTEQTRNSIQAVAALYGREIAGEVLTAEEWRSAAAAARWSDAAAAAAAARWSADAADAADAAAAAAAARWSADAAAAAAAARWSAAAAAAARWSAAAAAAAAAAARWSDAADAAAAAARWSADAAAAAAAAARWSDAADARREHYKASADKLISLLESA